MAGGRPQIGLKHKQRYMQSGASTGPRRIKVYQRLERMLKLRLSGLSEEQVAVQLGCSLERVHYSLLHLIKGKANRRDVNSLRGIEVERLDLLLNSLWSRAIDGDLKAVDRVLAVCKRAAELQGLDLTVKADTTVNITLAQLVLDSGLNGVDGQLSPAGEKGVEISRGGTPTPGEVDGVVSMGPSPPKNAEFKELPIKDDSMGITEAKEVVDGAETVREVPSGDGGTPAKRKDDLGDVDAKADGLADRQP